MEEVCTCKNCREQKWFIFQDRIECTSCGKEHKFGEETKATHLVRKTNDNA